MSVFESTLLSLCKPQSKLDLPTLRQDSRERKNATEQIKNMSLARIQCNIYIYIYIYTYIYACVRCTEFFAALKSVSFLCSFIFRTLYLV